jgi:hypothetical protein
MLSASGLYLARCRKSKPANDGKDGLAKDPSVKFLIAEDDDDDANETNRLVKASAKPTQRVASDRT